MNTRRRVFATLTTLVVVFGIATFVLALIAIWAHGPIIYQLGNTALVFGVTAVIGGVLLFAWKSL